MRERVIGSTSSTSNVHEAVNDNTNPYKNMVMDAMRMNQGNVNQCPIVNLMIGYDKIIEWTRNILHESSIMNPQLEK